MRFDLTDLRLFVHVLEAGTITAGAEASCITLASASERIRGMEARLGTPLLTRTPRGVAATPAGRTLLHHALQLLRQVEQLQGELDDHASGQRGHVRLLCNSAAMSDWLPDRLAGFLVAHPAMSVALEERGSAAIVDALRHGLCDMGVVADSVDIEGLQAHALRADPLVLAVPRGHELAGRTGVAFSEVLALELVGLSPGSALDEHLALHARRLGQRLRYRIRLRGFDAVCRMVAQGVAPAIVPQAVAVRCARQGGLQRVPLSDAWARRSLMLCVRDTPELPPPARRLLDWLLLPPPGLSRPPRARAG
ncbi:LysR family transcriptional regulator [Xylophilus rhododendri]|uniref:LysR family transcriptional regulator n=1 Tax=Xylophilus rhododendri TaxID=2697032 RepID=A0A857J3S2_9BURK|nr:LysR substrate-binding domain-containing protein [Xylophilus rhododendri]QHI98416.1 LysR family transcriptional regulator [Xylophilus rhododendri]